MITDFAQQLDARGLRYRAMSRVKRAIGCEVAHYTARRVADRAFYDHAMASSHIDDHVESLNGSPLYLGQELCNLTTKPWSIAAPLAVHRNQFALFHEDLDLSQLREAALWRVYYEPLGIADQVRALFYVEGDFLGYVGGFRGDSSSFTEDERAILNRLAPAVRNDLIVARSLEKEAAYNGSAHLVCDEGGKLLFANEAAKIWLDGERMTRLRTAILLGNVPVIDGMELAVEVLEPRGWRYVVLSTASNIRRRPFGSMNPRQRTIARLAAKGFSNAEIADSLDVATSTVKYHLRHIFREFGLSSRCELSSVDW